MNATVINAAFCSIKIILNDKVIYFTLIISECNTWNSPSIHNEPAHRNPRNLLSWYSDIYLQSISNVLNFIPMHLEYAQPCQCRFVCQIWGIPEISTENDYTNEFVIFTKFKTMDMELIFDDTYITGIQDADFNLSLEIFGSIFFYSS